MRSSAVKASRPIVMSESDTERFWAKVDKSGADDCWLWTAGLGTGGYGRFAVKREAFNASRVALTLSIGPIEDGLFACHTCNVPRCCNPSHLYAGTPKQNAQDCIDAGRFVYSFGRPVLETCKRGHSLSGDGRIKKGYCRICHRDRTAQYRAYKTYASNIALSN